MRFATSFRYETIAGIMPATTGPCDDVVITVPSLRQDLNFLFAVASFVGRAKRCAKVGKPDGETNQSIDLPTHEFPANNHAHVGQSQYIAQYIHGRCG